MKQKLKSIPRWVYIVLALLLIIGTAIAVSTEGERGEDSRLFEGS